MIRDKKMRWTEVLTGLDYSPDTCGLGTSCSLLNMVCSSVNSSCVTEKDCAETVDTETSKAKHNNKNTFFDKLKLNTND